MINWIVTSSVLILVVIALRFLLRGKISLRLQYALWGIVLLRLLMPFEIGTSDVSLMNAVEQVPVVQEFESVRTVEEIEQIDEEHVQIIYERTPEDVNRPVRIYEMTEEEFAHEKKMFLTSEILTAAWKAGLAVMLMVFFVTNVQFGMKLKRSRKKLETDRMQLEVDGVSLQVYVTNAVETPCLFGLFKPAIYVTPEAAADETVLHHTIQHETTHYLHKDHIWAVLRCIALALHWYNPLVWWAVKLSKDDGELACDEATINRIGEGERYAYGQTLIEMTRPGREILLGTATTMTGSKSTLKERIELIAKKPKMAAYTLATVVVTAAVAVVCTFSGSSENQFYKWLQSAEATGMTEAVASSGYGVSVISCQLDYKQKMGLEGVLRGIDKDSLQQVPEDDIAGNYYRLTLQMEAENDTVKLFHFYMSEEGQITMVFDIGTQEELCDVGLTWRMDSPELVSHISDLLAENGTGLMERMEIARADLDKDGVQEIITVEPDEEIPDFCVIQVTEEDGTVLWEDEAGLPHPGWNNILLYDEGGETVLLKYTPYMSQGFAYHSYKLFTLEGGQENVIDQGRVEFEYVDPNDPYKTEKSYPAEASGFLENMNQILEFCTILVSTEDGQLVLGPTSPWQLQRANTELLEAIQIVGEEPFDVVSAMANLQGTDITNPEDFRWTAVDTLAKAVRGAVDHQISYNEAAAAGNGNTDSLDYWRASAYLESNYTLGISGKHLHFDIACGLPEDIVEVSYGRSSAMSTAYFRDPELYNLLRYRERPRTGTIDEAAFARFEPILTDKMESYLKMFSEMHEEIYDYELIEFHQVYSYEEADGSVIELYDFDYGLLTNHTDRSWFAGGMHFDGYLRLRGFNGGGQLAVRYRNGEMAAYSFMGNDFYYAGEEVDWFDGYEKQQKDRLKSALDYAEKNRG